MFKIEVNNTFVFVLLFKKLGLTVLWEKKISAKQFVCA